MDQKNVIFLVSDAAVLLVFIIIKNYSFSKSSRKINIRRWLYFSNYEIINSTNEKVRSARKMQNRLSITLFVLIILSFIIFYFVRS